MEGLRVVHGAQPIAAWITEAVQQAGRHPVPRQRRPAGRCFIAMLESEVRFDRTTRIGNHRPQMGSLQAPKLASAGSCTTAAMPWWLPSMLT